MVQWGKGDQRGGVQGVPGAAGRPGGVEAQDRRFDVWKVGRGGCGGAGEAFHGGGGF